MPRDGLVATLSALAAPTLGVFHTRDAAACGISGTQLARLADQHVIERVYPSTYRMTVVAPSDQQRLHAALLWGGDRAAAAGRSAGVVYGLEGVRARRPELFLPAQVRGRSSEITVFHGDLAAQMVRVVRGIPTTGVEATLLRLAHLLDAEALEVACEDARRRRLTTVPALTAHLARFGRRGRPGVSALRSLLRDLDPVHSARSTLEVKTRRLLARHGLSSYTREHPLAWDGRVYCYDFVFERERVVLEVNGRRWHDDASDYEYDNEKWSVPGRLGYRIIFATWHKVTRLPDAFVREVATAIQRPAGIGGGSRR